MSLKILPTDLTREDLVFLDATPKAVLFAVAKHLAARLHDESYDLSIESGSYRDAMRKEWEALHRARIIPQKPPKVA